MKKAKISNIIKGYTVFPAIFAAILAAAAVVLFVYGKSEAGVIVLAALLVYVIVGIIFYRINNKNLQERLIGFGYEYGEAERKLLDDIPIPYAVTDAEGNILITNRRFCKIFGRTKENISRLFRELKRDDLRFEGTESEIAVEIGERKYRLHFNRIYVSENLGKEFEDFNAGDTDHVIAVYLFDDTEIVNLYRQRAEDQVIIGSLYVDNYNEVLEQVDDVNRSLITAMIDREILGYFDKAGGLVRKVEKDKYFIIFRRKALPAMQRTRFDILDNIRNIDIGVDMPATISLGIGAGGDFAKSQEYSKLALELALGRGGDQAVIKEGERVSFYGGKTKSVEKNSLVKARVTSLALREIITGAKRVVIMGHKTGDMDCFGASIGICKAARALNRDAYIVLDELNNVVTPMLEQFLDDPDYGDNVFIQKDDAEGYVDEDTALVIVDVNNPEIFEMPVLTRLTRTNVIIDHHLQTGAKVENLVLSYVEPTASSACEMVTELLQYIATDIRLKKSEAEALYAGILIDTNYFAKNTGVRTFEAAAYLKKSGVDVARVKRLFSDTLEDFKAKAETIKNAEIIDGGFAIAAGPSEGVENPTIVAAQVANELLDISGVNASFVMVDHDGQIYISARSEGNVNVQLIMERMGGGGHMNTAGTQLPGDTIEGAEHKLRITIQNMKEEGIL